MNISDDLYQQTILEYNRVPRNFRKMENPTHVARGLNPLCGDDYTVYLRVGVGGIIEEVSFVGHGCAISKASASLMTQELVGKSLTDAQQLCRSFQELATGKEQQLGKLNVFAGVWKYPERVKCAVLAWHAMESALSGKGCISTE